MSDIKTEKPIEMKTNSGESKDSSSPYCSAWVYHYAAITQGEFGSVNYIDGIADRSHEVLNFDDYLHLKSGIAEKAGIDCEKLSIISLSLIHEQNSQDQQP
jgi:hypothetical protein